MKGSVVELNSLQRQIERKIEAARQREIELESRLAEKERTDYMTEIIFDIIGLGFLVALIVFLWRWFM
jgi:hypothetical protein